VNKRSQKITTMPVVVKQVTRDEIKEKKVERKKNYVQGNT
jgi:hypothetical protein